MSNNDYIPMIKESYSNMDDFSTKEKLIGFLLEQIESFDDANVRSIILNTSDFRYLRNTELNNFDLTLQRVKTTFIGPLSGKHFDCHEWRATFTRNDQYLFACAAIDLEC